MESDRRRETMEDDDDESEEEYLRFEAHFDNAQKEARRTVKDLRYARITADTLPWRLAYVGWILAALGWLLFLASHFGYLEKGGLLELFKPVLEQGPPELLRQPFAVSETLLRIDAEAVTFEEHVRKLSNPSATSSTSNTSNFSSSSGGSANSGSHSSHHASHDSDALLFLFMAIVVSVCILYATMFKMFHGLQHTVSLFLAGVIYSLVMEIEKTYEELGIVGRSHDMWMGIDPHLLLFTMLPALLTADAMTIDTSVAIRVSKQCVYLAGPGVLFNASLTAMFLYYYLPYDWSFMLCLTTGSILCATDPVAVVALLKELGASPTLTVQIQGESLLNDGTAIVLYGISYNILKGESYGITDVIIYLVTTAVCAWALGTFVGMVFLEWIKVANRKLEHNSSLIQCTLTLCCAYWSFILAEGCLKISGVLSCVAASLVLAHKMWPAIVDKEFLHTIWHMFEYLGNTVIFFLAGALTGRNMAHIPAIDYIHLFVIYVILVIVRGTLLFASRPILNRLGPDGEHVQSADLLVMTWGGLRGAVGLSLAIQVNTERAEGAISHEDGQRVLFYVSGVAALTLALNATTCPMLVQRLGITQVPRAKQQMLRLFTKRLRHLSNARPHCGMVTKTISSMLDDIDHHLKGREDSEPRPPIDDTFFSLGPTETHDIYVSEQPGEQEERSSSKCTAPGLKESTNVSWHSGVSNLPGQAVDSPFGSAQEDAPRGSVSLRASCVSKTEQPVRASASFQMAVNKTVSDGERRTSEMRTSRRSKSEGGCIQNPTVLVSERAKDIIQGFSNQRFDPADPDKLERAANSAGKIQFQTTTSNSSAIASDVLRTSLNPTAIRLIGKGVQKKLQKKRNALQEGNGIVDQYKHAKAGVTAIKFLKIADNNFTEILRDIPKLSPEIRDQEEDLLHICMFLKPDKDLQRVFVEAFLKLVCSDYWKQIGSGAVPSQRDGETLLLSITLALSKGDAELWDYRYIREYIETGSLMPKIIKKSNSSALEHFAPTSVHRALRSLWFNVCIMIVILCSSFSSYVEEAMVGNGSTIWHQKRFWEAAEIVFFILFILEFSLKLWDLRGQYFSDSLNCFDFVLIWFALAGIVLTHLNTISEGGGADQGKSLSEKGRLVRGVRLFRVLRLMRILRIFRLLEKMRISWFSKKQVHSKAVSAHMQKVMMLRAFVHAHMRAQEEFVHTFCKDEQIDRPEIARVLIDSQTAVNLAIAEAVQVEQSVDKKLLTEVRVVRECTDIAEQLEKFVIHAHESGIVSSKEAASILHPLHHHLERFYRQLRRTQRGLSSTTVTKRMAKQVGSLMLRFNHSKSTLGDSDDGDYPIRMLSETHDLFAVDDERHEAVSRGWIILQKAFRGRNGDGRDAENWRRLMRSGARHRHKDNGRHRKRILSTGFGIKLTNIREEQLKDKKKGNNVPKCHSWATVANGAYSSPNGSPDQCNPATPTHFNATAGIDFGPKFPKDISIADEPVVAAIDLSSCSLRSHHYTMNGSEKSEAKELQDTATTLPTQEMLLLESITSEGFDSITPEEAKAALRDHGTVEKALDFLKVYRNGMGHQKFDTNESAEASLIDSEIASPAVVPADLSAASEISNENKEQSDSAELVDVITNESHSPRKRTNS